MNMTMVWEDNIETILNGDKLSMSFMTDLVRFEMEKISLMQNG